MEIWKQKIKKNLKWYKIIMLLKMKMNKQKTKYIEKYTVTKYVSYWTLLRMSKSRSREDQKVYELFLTSCFSVKQKHETVWSQRWCCRCRRRARPGGRAKTGPLHHCYGIDLCPALYASLAERPGLTPPLVNESVRVSSEGAWPQRAGALQIHCKRCIRERCWCWWCENNFTPEASFRTDREGDDGLHI